MEWLREHPRWLTAPAFVAIFIAFVLQILWPSLGDEVKPEFYSATAQIIPVLYLAILIELAVRRGGIGTARERLNALDSRIDNAVARRGANDELRSISDDVESLRSNLQPLSRWASFEAVGYSLAALCGEVTSLGVLAGGDSRTFTLVLAAGSLLAMFMILLLTFIDRFRI